MREWSRARLVLVIVTLGGSIMVGSLPASATAPAPVISVDALPPSDGAGGDEPSPEEEPAEETPEEDAGPGPTEGCLIGASAAARLLSYPGPLLPVEQEQLTSECLTRLSLSLTAGSEVGDEPDGADAAVESAVVPRAQLEAGFSTTLPSRTRVITLTDPGDEWEVMNVACTCAGGPNAAIGGDGTAGPGRLTSYPGPLIAITDPTAKPGSTACPAGTGSGESVAGSPAEGILAAPGPAAWRAPSAGGSSVRTVQPAPVISTDALPAPAPDQAEPPQDEAPPRQPGTISWDKDGTVRITDHAAAGGAFTCTWTVEHVYGDLRIRTLTEPPGREDQFSYRVTSSLFIVQAAGRTMPGSSSGSEEQLWKGPWQAELVPPSDAWEVQEATCTEGVTARPSTAGGSMATIGVDPGDTVECTFRVKLLAPKPGVWQARNGRGRVVCGPVSISLDPVTDRGRMQVRRDGDRLIARGLAQGATSPMILDRDTDDALLYRGRLPIRLQGVSGSFDATLRLVSEERMEGRLSGSVRFQGERCDFQRPLTLVYGG